MIRDHFILATKANKPQTELLEESDLLLAYRCIQDWNTTHSGTTDNDLFAFFNSGEHSGASQAHRHLQFLPVEAMEENGGEQWDVLCKSMDVAIHGSELCHNPKLPFLHFASRLNSSMSAGDIHERYRQLLRAGFASVHGTPLDSLNTASLTNQGKVIISYNLAMTRNVLAIMPRRNESSSVVDVLDSSIAINGTILAGTMMVKNEKEWDRLREKPELVNGLLHDIGFQPRQIGSTKDKENL